MALSRAAAAEAPQSGSARRLHAWWVGAYALLVACASLYPFGFDIARLADAAASGFAAFFVWRDPARRDLYLNLLAYLPVGLGASLALPARLAAPSRFMGACACGAALSLAIELAQFANPVRVPSLADTTLNVLSSAIGALLALVLAGRPAFSLSRRLRRLHVSPALAMLVLVWIASHAAPFLPRRRLSAMLEAVDGLVSLELTIGGLAASMAAFLVLSALLRTLLTRESFWGTFAALVALSLAARVLFVGQQLTLDEPLALLLTLPLIARLRDRNYVSAQTPLFVFVCIAWFVQGLAPFELTSSVRPMLWLPFPELFGVAPDGGYVDVLRRAFVCIGAVWVAAGSSFGLTRGTLVLLAIVVSSEVAQRHLATRVPDTTDVVLVLFGALLVHAADRSSRATT